MTTPPRTGASTFSEATRPPPLDEPLPSRAADLETPGTEQSFESAARQANEENSPRYLLDDQREAHNFRLGPIYFRFGAGLRLEYSDNIDNASDDRQSDLLARPEIYLTGHWEVTKVNDLTLRLGFGYSFYFAHPELNSSSSTFELSPETEISFKAKVGEVLLNFYERPTLGQETNDALTLPSGFIFSTFQNIAGVSAFLDLNDVRIQGGYQRTDTYPLTSETRSAERSGDDSNSEARRRANNDSLSSLNRSIDTLSAVFTFRLQDETSLGVEVAASRITYRENSQSNGFSYNAGGFLGKQLTNYITLRIAAGYQLLDFESQGVDGSSSNAGNPYFNVEFKHRVNRYLQHLLSMGYEASLGTSTDSVQTVYITDIVTYNVTKDLALNLTLSYQRGEESGSTNAEALSLFRVGLSCGFNLTKKLAVGISYDFVSRTGGGANGNFDEGNRFARASNDDYYQNRIGVNFSYAF